MDEIARNLSTLASDSRYGEYDFPAFFLVLVLFFLSLVFTQRISFDLLPVEFRPRLTRAGALRACIDCIRILVHDRRIVGYGLSALTNLLIDGVLWKKTCGSILHVFSILLRS